MADQLDFTEKKAYTKHRLKVKNLKTAAELFETESGTENFVSDVTYVIYCNNSNSDDDE